ncbi:hypothetical protein BTZ20_2859 [Rhodococcus sp. MTM3W5.2]|nr:hypothetical protein BTZ20_2859 [Rhodococcus sp. MTM3W5.2]
MGSTPIQEPNPRTDLIEAGYGDFPRIDRAIAPPLATFPPTEPTASPTFPVSPDLGVTLAQVGQHADPTRRLHPRGHARRCLLRPRDCRPHGPYGEPLSAGRHLRGRDVHSTPGWPHGWH